jgi:small multidrug resistance pump
MQWYYLAISILSEVVGTSALRACEGFTRWQPSAIVIIGYSLAFYFFSLALRAIPLGIAYAIWAGAGIALISVIGYLLYRQPLDLPALIGISLIVSGTAVMSLFSKTLSY